MGGKNNWDPSKTPILKKQEQNVKETEVMPLGKKEQRRAVNTAHLFQINMF